MRVAVLILGLMLWFLFIIQALLVSAFGDAANDDSMEQGGAVGVLVAIIWLVGCAMVIAIPRVATGLFLSAGALAWLAAGTTSFSDLWFWGGVALFLAVLSYIGSRQKRKKELKERERDQLITDLARNQAILTATTVASTQRPCPACGQQVAAISKFCPSCGGTMTGLSEMPTLG